MPELTIVSFNAHAGMQPRPIAFPWRVRSLAKRPGRGSYDLGRALLGFDADVIVVQESYRSDDGNAVVETAARARGMELHENVFGRAVVDPYPHLVRGGTGVKGLAVLTRLPARRLPDTPIRRVWTDPAPTRSALRVELDVKDIPLELIAVHLTSKLPYGPPLQMAQLRRALPPRERRAIVVGDLNFWGPPSVSLLRGWRRSVRGRTWPAHRPHSQIDHVLVRDDVEVLETEVLPDVGSDHRPIRVRLRLLSSGR